MGVSWTMVVYQMPFVEALNALLPLGPKRVESVCWLGQILLGWKTDRLFLLKKSKFLFSSEKTKFFFSIKKNRFCSLFFVHFFLPSKKNRKLQSVWAAQRLGCLNLFIFWFHIWASKFVHPQRAPAFLPKTSAFSEIFGATLHLETLQSLRAEVLLNNIRPIDRSVVGDWCNPNPNVTANPDLLLTGNFGLEIDAALYDYFGIAFRDPDACQFEASTEAFIFRDVHVIIWFDDCICIYVNMYIHTYFASFLDVWIGYWVSNSQHPSTSIGSTTAHPCFWMRHLQQIAMAFLFGVTYLYTTNVGLELLNSGCFSLGVHL